MYTMYLRKDYSKNVLEQVLWDPVKKHKEKNAIVWLTSSFWV